MNLSTTAVPSMARNQSFKILVFPIEPLRRIYAGVFDQIAHDYHLSEAHYEELFSWLVKQAITDVLTQRQLPSLFQHTRHDVYLCIYDDCLRYFDLSLEGYFLNLFRIHEFRHQNRSDLQVMVSGGTLILSVGVYTTPRID